jgi:plasmid stabilization system protein ParE
LEAAFTLVTSQPKIGMPAPESNEENVRRLHLRRTDYYLYCRHSDDLIEILVLWHVRRGTAPPL